MSRVRTPALLAVILSALVLPAVAAAKEPPQRRMLDRVNAVRAKHGLRPLRPSGSLSYSSRRYARKMMRRDFFGHSRRIHASRRFRTLGEIIEMHRTHRPGVRVALRGWLRSPSHRSIVLSRRFRQAGAGFARGRFRGRRMTIWVMHFGRR